MEGFEVVYRAAGLPEAELIKGYLESGDIPVDLDYESAGRVYGLTMDGLGEVRILVPCEYAEEARMALAARPGIVGKNLYAPDSTDSSDSGGPEAA
jgi:hypothetical protein